MLALWEYFWTWVVAPAGPSRTTVSIDVARTLTVATATSLELA